MYLHCIHSACACVCLNVLWCNKKTLNGELTFQIEGDSHFKSRVATRDLTIVYIWDWWNWSGLETHNSSQDLHEDEVELILRQLSNRKPQITDVLMKIIVFWLIWSWVKVRSEDVNMFGLRERASSSHSSFTFTLLNIYFNLRISLKINRRGP